MKTDAEQRLARVVNELSRIDNEESTQDQRVEVLRQSLLELVVVFDRVMARIQAIEEKVSRP
jgi:hypothetical protein